ncbi:hypothetical protein [Flavivirga algicola]|uniref:DUF4488 domain-containing protein n=1 Tax=Flavivirga algicola TaxID=2729136 RepID=A0ABX1RTY9_9FLAO|nr:hypothetical protein [Flavivirga algicola]NMH86543.1 hypothetical protein [Flavivirga algicola]
MKKILILLLAIPLLSLTTKNDTSRFIGKWKGEDNGDIGYIIFDKEGYATFEIQGKTFGGKEFVLKEEKGSLTYKIDDSKDPIQVDFIITKLATGEEKRLLCIANFLDTDTMEFAINYKNNRPTEFDTENSIILKREK